MIIDMRLPVTSSRRCEQITAFGASDVPDVKINAQIESTSGSSPGSAASGVRARARRRATRRAPAVRRRARRTGRRRGSAAVRSPRGASNGSWRGSVSTRPQCVCSASRSRCSSRRVWLRPDDRAADERRAAEREEIVGRVVEQHRDVTRRARRQPLEEQRREAARLLEVLGVRPLPVAELDRDVVAELARVAPQQRGRVLGDQRRLPGRGRRARGDRLGSDSSRSGEHWRSNSFDDRTARGPGTGGVRGRAQNRSGVVQKTDALQLELRARLEGRLPLRGSGLRDRADGRAERLARLDDLGGGAGRALDAARDRHRESYGALHLPSSARVPYLTIATVVPLPPFHVIVSVSVPLVWSALHRSERRPAGAQRRRACTSRASTEASRRTWRSAATSPSRTPRSAVSAAEAGHGERHRERRTRGDRRGRAAPARNRSLHWNLPLSRMVFPSVQNDPRNLQSENSLCKRRYDTLSTSPHPLGRRVLASEDAGRVGNRSRSGKETDNLVLNS